MKIKVSVLKTFYIILVLIVLGCNQKFQSESYSSSNADQNNLGAPGIESFKTGLYAFAQARNCVKCHGSLIRPHFASLDIDSAYAVATGFRNGSTTVKLIDFSNPAASVFIEYAGNSHCSDTPCGDPAVRPNVQKALEDWAAAEMSTNVPAPGSTPPPGSTPVAVTYKYLTASLKVPATIPSILVTAPALLRFPLSGLKPPVAGLANAILEIEVHMASDSLTVVENQYRLMNPKIVGSTTALGITNVSVFMKATNDNPNEVGLENMSVPVNWHSVVFNLPITALPAPIPATRFVAPSMTGLPIFFPTRTKTDYFTIGFGDIIAGTIAISNPPPPPVDPFAVGRNLFQLNCVRCHTAVAKQNRTAAQITAAIVNIAAMRTIVLTQAEIIEISRYLSNLP